MGLGVLHCVIGFVLFAAPLREIVAAGLWNTLAPAAPCDTWRSGSFWRRGDGARRLSRGLDRTRRRQRSAAEPGVDASRDFCGSGDSHSHIGVLALVSPGIWRARAVAPRDHAGVIESPPEQFAPIDSFSRHGFSSALALQ